MDLAKFTVSRKSLPDALSILIVGLMLATCAGSFGQALASAFHLTLNQADFANGFFIGLGLTLEIGALILLCTCLPCRRHTS
ncbi:MAG: hypothetical protein ABSD67_25090 [Terracidiphilus sp.]|jgi:hypothetical protein